MSSSGEAACSDGHVLISTAGGFGRLVLFPASSPTRLFQVTERLIFTPLSRCGGVSPHPNFVISTSNYPHIRCLPSFMFHLVPKVPVLTVFPAAVFSKYGIRGFSRSAFLVSDCFLFVLSPCRLLFCPSLENSGPLSSQLHCI